MKKLLRHKLAVLACSACWTLPLTAQVPNLLSHQGRVAVNGVNFNGNGQFKFALVNDEGTVIYWSNAPDEAPADGVPDAAVSLTVTKGLYSVMLGDTESPNMAEIPTSVYQNDDLRLRVWFNDGINGFQLLSPDQRLAPNGYLPSGAISAGNLAEGSITTSKIAAGTVISSQTVEGASHTMAANTSYSASGAALTTFTLPTSASIGDVVQVSGTGSGGWTVMPQSGQSIVGPWIPRESNRNWSSIASSADGTKLVAAVSGGQIYTSTDSGVSWTPREEVRSWRSVASSADGTKLVAVASGGVDLLYTSTDSGVSWTRRETTTFYSWQFVASSADGTKLVAVAGGHPYTSTDSGVTWTQRMTEFDGLTSVASSADGTNLVAVGTRIYTSADSGETWISRESPRTYTSVATSADGTKLVALASGGQIYTSTDSGISWTPRETNRRWRSVASSADGTKLVAVVNDSSLLNDGEIYTSTDSGISWTPREGGRDWRAVASSADGNKLAAAVDDGQIYTSATVGGGQGQSAVLQYLGGNEWTQVGITGNGAGLTGINANNLIGAVPPTSLTSVPAESLTGSVPPTSLTSVPAASLTGSIPSTSLTAVPAESLIGSISAAILTGSIPSTSLTSVPAASLTGSVPSSSLTSVPAASLTGSIPSNLLTSVPAESLTGSVPPQSLTVVPAANLTGYVPSSSLVSVPATSLTGSVPSATLTSVPASSLTGSVPSAALTSVPAASLTGSVPSSTLTSVPAANLTGSVPPASLTSVPAASLTGLVADSRLSSNVALRSGGNYITGNQFFDGQFVSLGNTGIGSIPETRLHVNSLDSLTVMRLQSSATPGFARLELVSSQGSNAWRPGYIESTDAGSFTGGLKFVTNGTGAANKFGEVETMRIQNGSVGIGTTSPGQKLQVGDVNTSNSLGMMRFASRSGSGPANRYWDIGVPQAGEDASGKYYSFVIDDPQLSTEPEVVVRFDTGNMGIGVNSPASKLHVNGTVTATAFNPPSDRNLKENFETVNSRAVLEKVAALPISRWNFIGDAETPHIGPMAQDFHAAFGTGTDDKHIATVDADGVALAAIQGLNEKLEEKEDEIRVLRESNLAMERRLAALEELLQRMPSANNPATQKTTKQ